MQAEKTWDKTGSQDESSLELISRCQAQDLMQIIVKVIVFIFGNGSQRIDEVVKIIRHKSC